MYSCYVDIESAVIQKEEKEGWIEGRKEIKKEKDKEKKTSAAQYLPKVKFLSRGDLNTAQDKYRKTMA